MAMISAKCTQCGANLETDDEKDAGICLYCGTAFVTQKAINNYNMYVTAHITVDGASVDKMFGLAEESKLTEAEEKCKRLLAAGMFYELIDEAEKLAKEYPDNPAGYAYVIMGFPEYYYYGTERCREILDNRSYNALLKHPFLLSYTLPFAEYYEALVRLAHSNPEYKNKYGAVIERAEKLCADYAAIMEKRIAVSCKKWVALSVASIVIAIASVFLTAFVNLVFCTLIIFFGIMGMLFVYFVTVRSRQMRLFRKNNEKQNNR